MDVPSSVGGPGSPRNASNIGRIIPSFTAPDSLTTSREAAIIEVREMFRSILSTGFQDNLSTGEAFLEADLKYVVGFHALVILIAIFGASVTFPLIVTPLADPTEPTNAQVVRNLLGISWMLFVVAALLTCLLAGNAYSNRYMKTIQDARKITENARQKAMKLDATISGE
jgi:hypothetical protein